MKKTLLVATAIFFFLQGGAQTLFTYGQYRADAKDFLRAFNKNNNTETGAKKMTAREYLDLYIASRLKIREAYDRGIDTLPQIRAEMENLRSQIIENYLTDPEVVNKLVKEAFARSQKDIHAAYIYVSARDAAGKTDTAAAFKKINQAWNELKKGAGFGATAQKYSEDPAAAVNKGDIGFITVFSLPYELETAVYKIPAGKFSAPLRTKNGYLLFKNIEERKAVGKASAAQILLAYPPNVQEAGKKEIATRADSLYKLIRNGADFGKLAGQFSNDYISAANNGNMAELGTGQYDLEFEKNVFGLTPGAVSKPFETSHGWHIVKLSSIKPVVSDPANTANMNELKLKVEADPRVETAKDLLYGKVVAKAGMKKFPYEAADLWAYTDSVLDYKPSGRTLKVKPEQPLFTIGKIAITVKDWVEHAQTWRYKADGSGIKPYPQVMEEFNRKKALDYYREHLEEFNEDFRNYMNEFKDGNLFFEIMQREIWTKAQDDNTVLKSYYEQHKTKYTWNESADAVIFYAADEVNARQLYEMVKKNPADWRSFSEAFAEKAIADSSRFELVQLPGITKTNAKESLLTDVVINKTDNSASFTYVIRLYGKNMQRNFEEAKGLVISDYQEELEKNWLQELKKKYPVKINQAVLNKIAPGK